MTGPVDPFEPDPDFWRNRLSEPLDRYIREYGNPQTEDEAVAMVMAVDPTLDEYDARDQLDEDFHFTEDGAALIVPLATVLAIPPRGQDASDGDVMRVWIFWSQLLPLVMPDGEKWDMPDGGVEDGKINRYGIAATMHWSMQASWLSALAQWMSAYTGRLLREDPRPR